MRRRLRFDASRCVRPRVGALRGPMAGIRSEHWLETIRGYRRRFFSMIGGVHRIDLH